MSNNTQATNVYFLAGAVSGTFCYYSYKITPVALIVFPSIPFILSKNPEDYIPVIAGEIISATIVSGNLNNFVNIAISHPVLSTTLIVSTLLYTGMKDVIDNYFFPTQNNTLLTAYEESQSLIGETPEI